MTWLCRCNQWKLILRSIRSKRDTQSQGPYFESVMSSCKTTFNMTLYKNNNSLVLIIVLQPNGPSVNGILARWSTRAIAVQTQGSGPPGAAGTVRARWGPDTTAQRPSRDLRNLSSPRGVYWGPEFSMYSRCLDVVPPLLKKKNPTSLGLEFCVHAVDVLAQPHVLQTESDKYVQTPRGLKLKNIP